MKSRITILTTIILLLFGAAGCDLEVENLNQPETERVLGTADDLEGLVGGAVATWWNLHDNYLGMRPIWSTKAFQHSAMAANFGMVQYSQIPRPVYNNSPADDFMSYKERTWYHSYRAISAASDGLRVLAAGDMNLPAERDARTRAVGKFVQGVAHGTLAIYYDQAFVFDESMDPGDRLELIPYDQVLDAALGYLDDAIAIAEANSFSIPPAWGLKIMTNNNLLADGAKAMKAYFMANVPRTPAEADNVNWTAVRDLIIASNGIDFDIPTDGEGDTYFTYGLLYLNFPGAWSQINNMVLGMADQSGEYQSWMGTPVGNREPFIIQTPDQRFPQGVDQEEQEANPGMYMEVGPVGGQWVRADRGSWRWSYYRDTRFDPYLGSYSAMPLPFKTYRQLRLIQAEAHYRLGEEGLAADIVNETRVEHGGLTATDAGGANEECVPRLPDGSCGDLFEIIKWEYRLETYHHGMAPWYLGARRWGDLHEGTILHQPVPGGELETFELDVYTFGPGVGGAAPVGTYGY